MAAAAVTASAIDVDLEGLSDGVIDYIRRLGRPSADLTEQARRALDRVGRDGERAELWDETDDRSWREGLASLDRRLRA